MLAKRAGKKPLKRIYLIGYLKEVTMSYLITNSNSNKEFLEDQQQLTFIV
jgi:hypothetical protein